LRIGVKQTGCSGYAYTYDFADEVLADDQLFEGFDAKVVLDKDTMKYIDGSSLDFVNEGLKQVFKVENPKVTAMCGCGESFSIKI
jgi:iron-sulfur cluster assembly protein